MKVKISAVIITFNEERNIERCLDSLEGIADEIIVVDSFSTDRTEEICRSKGAVFIQHAFEGHVEQKNWAMKQAHYSCVLSLDADEALSETLRGSVLYAKNNWQYDGYEMNRLTNYCGKWIRHCGWYPDRKLRLWNREKGHWGGLNPHDKFEMEAGTRTGFLKGDLFHYSFYSVEQHIRQIHYFSDVASKALYKAGKRSDLLKMLIHPLAKFVKGYFVHRGFLDGRYGWVICRLSAYSNYLKYKKLRNLQNTRGN